MLKLYNEVSLAGNEQEQLHLGNSAAAVKWGQWLYEFASTLSSSYTFVNREHSSKLVKQIVKKIQDATSDKLSTFYLFQRGNAQCVHSGLQHDGNYF